MTTGRQQHIIPQFYLRRFLSPGFVYRKGHDNPQMVPSPKHVAFEDRYYEVADWPDDLPSLDKINTKLESMTAPALARLIESATPVDSGTKHTVAYLIANLSLRVPATIQAIGGTVLNVMEQADDLLKAQMKHFEETGTTPPLSSGFEAGSSSHTYTPEEWESELESLRGEVAAGKPMMAESMRLIPHLVPFIESMSWVVLAAPRDRYFLTSDRPVALTLIDGSIVGAGWGRTDALATLPLSPDRFLVLCGTPPGMSSFKRGISKKDIRKLNLRTISHARMEVYSPKENPFAEEWMTR